MLKKNLIKQCEDLFEKLNSANATISKQKKSIEALKEEILRLNDEIEALKVQQVVIDENDKTEEVQSEENIIDVPNEVVESIVEVKSEIAIETPKEDNITDYASAVIGKIVIEATKKSNQLSLDGKTSENKELINLILGRTEVAKSEILNIVLSNFDDSDKKISIDKIYLESCEYFKGIMLQY